jgi:Spy/CpxP family protein refolding chaperone
MWKAILAALVIFGAGVVTGGMLVRLTQPPPQPASPRSLPPAAAQWQLQLLTFGNRVERELSLTSTQRRQVDRIIAESQKRVRGVWDPIAEQMRDELRRAHEEIRAILTPEQRKQFDERLKVRFPRRPEGETSTGERRPREGRNPARSLTNAPPTTNTVPAI